MFGTLLETLGTIGIVIVLVVFFLIRREDLRDRFIHLVGKGQVTVTTQMLEDAGARVSRYLSMLFLINVTFGVSVGVGLYLIGVPNALLWGILAAALRFIPYIGPWIAAAMPIGLSMAISTRLVSADPDGWAVCCTRTLQQQRPGALALWEEHRRVACGDSGGGCLLAVAMGTCRAAAGDAH